MLPAQRDAPAASRWVRRKPTHSAGLRERDRIPLAACVPRRHRWAIGGAPGKPARFGAAGNSRPRFPDPSAPGANPRKPGRSGNCPRPPGSGAWALGADGSRNPGRRRVRRRPAPRSRSQGHRGLPGATFPPRQTRRAVVFPVRTRVGRARPRESPGNQAESGPWRSSGSIEGAFGANRIREYDRHLARIPRCRMPAPETH